MANAPDGGRHHGSVGHGRGTRGAVHPNWTVGCRRGIMGCAERDDRRTNSQESGTTAPTKEGATLLVSANADSPTVRSLNRENNVVSKGPGKVHLPGGSWSILDGRLTLGSTASRRTCFTLSLGIFSPYIFALHLIVHRLR